MQVKFICLNLWLGGLISNNIAEFLEKEKPDILAVQEAYNGPNSQLQKRFRSIDVIKKLGDFEYDFFSPACVAVIDDMRIDAGNAIFSKFSIVDSRTIFFDVPFGEVTNYEAPGGDYSMTPRNLQHAVIQVGSNKLNVFNTQGIWGKDSEDNERRLAMSEVITNEIKDKQNTLLTGDFNLMPHTKSVANIEHHMVNLFKDKIKTTFNLKQKNNPVLANVVVDMMFASKDIKIVDAYCPDADVSDHLPLISIIEI